MFIGSLNKNGREKFEDGEEVMRVFSYLLSLISYH